MAVVCFQKDELKAKEVITIDKVAILSIEQVAALFYVLRAFLLKLFFPVKQLVFRMIDWSYSLFRYSPLLPVM